MIQINIFSILIMCILISPIIISLSIAIYGIIKKKKNDQNRL